ncbi:MAG: FAD/NAD(P)-binding oxidoreductase [Verrucomicrobiia bacterium]
MASGGKISTSPKQITRGIRTPQGLRAARAMNYSKEFRGNKSGIRALPLFVQSLHFLSRDIVIVGNGITGVTAARHIRKRSAEDRITIISGETDHHFSRTALMYIYMGDLTYDDTKPYPDEFWAKNRIDLRRGWVERIDTENRSVVFRDGKQSDYDELVLATGACSNKFGWPGQDLDGVQGLYSYQDLELMEKYSATTQRAVIVGGGLIGVEIAEMLRSRGIEVVFLVREKAFWSSVLPLEEAELVGREILRHGVDLRYETELREILPDEKGRARAVVTNTGEQIDCQMVFLTTGVSPNIGFVKSSGIECDRGILVDEFFRTSTPHIWAGGDCAQHRTPPRDRRPVEQVWYTGKMHGEHIAANLCGERRPYDPGLWFNSAKFFDIEYQTYGVVHHKERDHEEDFYWEHPGDGVSFRLRFERESRAVTGVNVFGLRHRHAVWEHWIARKTPVSEVMADLGAANFDPEFYRQHEPAIRTAFNAKFPEHAVQPRTGKGLFSGFFRNLVSRRETPGTELRV